MGNSVLETDMAWGKVSLWFHLKSDWMNRLDEYEAISGIQSLTVQCLLTGVPGLY